MQQRLAYSKFAPQGISALRNLQAYINDCGLEPSLLELVKTRASQINGCAYCLDMHTKDARAAGESEQRLYLLSAWRETSFYSARERAALAWTEAITRIAESPVDDPRRCGVNLVKKSSSTLPWQWLRSIAGTALRFRSRYLPVAISHRDPVPRHAVRHCST